MNIADIKNDNAEKLFYSICRNPRTAPVSLCLNDETIRASQCPIKEKTLSENNGIKTLAVRFALSETLEMLGEKGASYNQSIQESISDYVRPENARYNSILTNLDNTSYDALMYMLSPDGAEDESARYVMMGNSVYDEASSSASMFESLTLIFGIVGGVLAGLSALLLFNYISVSISDKRKEIGILRAVGARGSDVFKIFICESIMIAVICGILAIIGAFAACVIINKMTVTSAIAIELLNFGIVNALIVFGMTLVVAFIGTVLPVILAARKVPVESIRAL